MKCSIGFDGPDDQLENSRICTQFGSRKATTFIRFCGFANRRPKLIFHTVRSEYSYFYSSSFANFTFSEFLIISLLSYASRKLERLQTSCTMRLATYLIPKGRQPIRFTIIFTAASSFVKFFLGHDTLSRLSPVLCSILNLLSG